MDLEYVLIDVFAEAQLAGNPLAVFPDAAALPDELMQGIARELNLSETAFVTSSEPTRYASRIFTPGFELPFAGHPTLGTAWVLRDVGRLTGAQVVQQTKAGQTPVEFVGDKVWLERTGDGGVDEASLASQLGIDRESIGLKCRDAGGAAVELVPAIADAGIPQLMVPLRTPEALGALTVADVREPPGTFGSYFFSFSDPEDVSARFFGTNVGVPEDAATGSAAAALGLYLGQRLGKGRIVISQGSHLGRPSRLHVEFDSGRVKVGGQVIPVGRGVLTIGPLKN